MKRVLIISALSLFFVVSALGQRLVILHTNDLHSRLKGFSPESEYSPMSQGDDNTYGGFARLSSAIERERGDDRESVLLLDAGDFLMGSLFHTLEQETGFQLGLMADMGYDAIAIGNHEFDFGPTALASTITAASLNSGIPELLMSNAVFDPEYPGDDALAELYEDLGHSESLLQPYIVIHRNGLRIGLFALLGKDAQDVAPAARPISFTDPVETAGRMVKMLREQKEVDVVICLSHSGVWKQKDGSWGGEDVELAEKVPGIDVIISGHTHTHLFQPLIVNGTPIVQAGAYGAFLGRLEIEYRDGEVHVVGGRLIPIDDSFEGDNDMHMRILEEEQRVDEQVLSGLGLRCSDLIVESGFPLLLDEDTLLEFSNLGALIADATYTYANRFSPAGTDLSFFAAGMVRDQMPAGIQSTADIFRAVSLGNGLDGYPGFSMATVYVTGRELKGIMEVLYLAPSMSKSNYVYIGGAEVFYDARKGFLRKIREVRLTDPSGEMRSIDLSRKNQELYAITANTYLLEFMGLIRQVTKGLVKVTLKDAQGNPITDVSSRLIDIDPDIDGIQEAKEWIAVLEYMRSFADTNADGIPDVPEMYRRVLPAMRQAEN